MLQRSIDSFQEHTPAVKPSFTDRGIPDTLAYARLIGLSETGFIEIACRLYRYEPVVFLAPPWEEIYQTDTERKQDFAEARLTYRYIVQAYTDYGYEIVELPKLDPTARAPDGTALGLVQLDDLRDPWAETRPDVCAGSIRAPLSVRGQRLQGLQHGQLESDRCLFPGFREVPRRP